MTVTTSTQETTTRLLASGTGLLPRVNLLPPEIAERRVFRRVQGGLGAGVAAVLVLMVFVVLAASHSVSSAESDLAASQAEQTRLESRAQTYANVSAIYAAADAAQAQLVTAMGDEIRFSQLLTDLSLSIPSSVWVTSVAMAATPPLLSASGTPALGTFTVSGLGFSHNDVGLWLESIAGLKTYSDPYFSSSAAALMGTRRTVNFTSTATLTPAALSGRYTQQSGG